MALVSSLLEIQLLINHMLFASTVVAALTLPYPTAVNCYPSEELNKKASISKVWKRNEQKNFVKVYHTTLKENCNSSNFNFACDIPGLGLSICSLANMEVTACKRIS